MRMLFFGLSFFMLCGCRSSVPQQDAAAALVRQKQLFVVIDDAGLALEETQQFLDIPVPMTMAVLPHLKDTKAVCAAIARHADKEIILHQPMAAYDTSLNPGQGAVPDTAVPADIPLILDRNLASVRGAKGMNNHMGSRVTENPVLMQAVLRYCNANGLYFLDSKTAFNSVVERVARRVHMHFEERHFFLDIQHDREAIRHMWGQAVGKARESGYAIVIGHAWSAETAATIRDSFQTLENQGYTFHLLSELYE